MELAAGISGYVLRNEATGLVENSLTSTMKQFPDPEYAYIANIWNKVQRGVSTYIKITFYFEHIRFQHCSFIYNIL